MAFQMKLDTSELKAWVNNQPNRDRAKRQSLTVMKNKLVEEVLKEVGKHTTTGQLAISVMGIADDHKIQIRSSKYGDIVLEYGRRPGGYPPLDPIRNWVQTKMGVPYSQNYMLAKTIQRNIHDRGTQKYHSGRDKAGTGRQISEIEDRFNNKIMPEQMYILLHEYTK